MYQWTDGLLSPVSLNQRKVEMKIIKQIGIIFSVCWISLIIEKLFPGIFPASIIGMVLLFLCLAAGVLKIEHIQEKADFLLENMAFFFIPAGVSIINYMDVLKNVAVQLVIICAASTVVTFAVTAYAVRFTMFLMEKRKCRKTEETEEGSEGRERT